MAAPAIWQFFLAASFAVFVLGVVIFFKGKNKEDISLRRRLVILALCVVTAAFFVQLTVSCDSEDPWYAVLSGCFVSTMQMFSLDADYGEIVTSVAYLSGVDLCGHIAAGYACFVNVLASVTGGAIILEILAGVFPSMRLVLRRRHKLYVFSELNSSSLALAQDIVRQRPDGEKPVIVFTDVYKDDGDELRSELHSQAVSLGAICLDDDLLYCGDLRRNRLCSIFFMDEKDGRPDAQSNLTSLCSLLSPERYAFWERKSECMVFFFCDDEQSVLTANEAVNRFCAAMPERLIFRPINPDRSMVWKQLISVPLYTPLTQQCESEEEARLSVAILGNGPAAQEMLKSVFWCGQLLWQTPEGEYRGRPLSITMVAPGMTGKYPEWLYRDSPELIRTCDPESELLRIYADRSRSEKAPPYCDLRFINTPLCGLDISEYPELINADYYFVMSGDDSLNAELAAGIVRSLRRRAYITHSGSALRQVIACRMRNDSTKNAFAGRFEGETPRLVTFGSLHESFSWASVSMDDIYVNGAKQEVIDRRHWVSADGQRELMDTTGEKQYQRQSNITRSIHQSYKMFSAGCCEDTEYARKTSYLARISADTQLFAALTWLEHRRWNAYTRSVGYVYPGDDAIRPFKNRGTGLHPCLAECSPIPGDEPDMLDFVNAARGKDPVEIKNYDVPGVMPVTGSVGAENAPGFTGEELLCYVGVMSPSDIGRLPHERISACVEQLAAACPELAVSSDAGGALNKYGMYLVDRVGREKVNVKKYRSLLYGFDKAIGLPRALRADPTPVRAYELGAGSETEQRLIEEGRLVLRPDGQYEIFSQEARDGSGEIAQKGDFIKLDGAGYPYPNRREFFLKNNEPAPGGGYMMKPTVRTVWCITDPMFEEIAFLLSSGRLRTDPEHPETFYHALLWGSELSAARDAVIIVNKVVRSEDGTVTDVDFHFVARREFDRTYTYVYDNE